MSKPTVGAAIQRAGGRQTPERSRSGSGVLGVLLFSAWASGCALSERAPRGLDALIAQATQLHFVMSYDVTSQTLILANGTGKPALTALHLEGALPRAEPIPIPDEWPIAPALSPGGRRLVYGVRRKGDDTTRTRLFLLDRESGQSRLLLDRDPRPEVEAKVVSFSPSGERLAFDLKLPGGRSEVRVLELDPARSPSAPVQRIEAAAGAYAPAWSPDSQTLYFLSGRCLLARALVTASTQEVVCLPETHAPQTGGFPLAVSPDGSRIALTVNAPDCLGIVILDVAARTWSMPDPHECSWRPTWNERARASLAYVRLDPATNDRMPALRDLETGVRSLTGLQEGVTYAVAAEPGGSLLALASTPTHPPALWRAYPAATGRAAELLHTPMPLPDFEILVRYSGRTTREWAVAEDGARVPLVLFVPAGGRKKPGPAVLWLHGGVNGKTDVSPRWKQEIQYLLQAGYTVAAVNYRGSTGYGNGWTLRGQGPDGKPDRAVMAADARAAAVFLRARAEVDPQQLYVLSSSWGAGVAARLVASEPSWWKGAVQLDCSSGPWQQAGAGAPLRSFPPLLVVAGTLDPAAELEQRLAIKPSPAYRSMEWLWVEDGHGLHHEHARTQALQRVVRFLRETR